MPTKTPEYRIEQLAQLTHLTVRSIREFQDRGLIAPPVKQGRIALYGPEHLTRLELVLRLQKRGYALAGIRDLLDAWAGGHNLDEVLGLDRAVGGPWTAEPSAVFTAEELTVVFGTAIPDEAIARMVRQNLMVVLGDGRYECRSPGLIDAARDLIRIGTPLETILEVIERVQGLLVDPADQLIGMVWSQIFPQDPQTPMPTGPALTELAKTISELRPHALKAVETLFADAMTAAINRRYDEVTDRVRSQHPREPDSRVS